MQLLDEHLWTLYERGQIEAADMLDRGRQPAELQERLEKAGKLHEAGDALVNEVGAFADDMEKARALFYR